MFGALKTVEEKNLYSSFGLTDGLSDCELEDINGGWCVNFTVTICSGNGNGSGNSGGITELKLPKKETKKPAASNNQKLSQTATILTFVNIQKRKKKYLV